MSPAELRTLDRVFDAIEKLRDRMDERFDDQDARLRKVEQSVATAAGVEAERTANAVSKRWVIGVVVALGGFVVGSLTLVLRLLLPPA